MQLIPRIYKEFLQTSKKEAAQFFKNMQKTRICLTQKKKP